MHAYTDEAYTTEHSVRHAYTNDVKTAYTTVCTDDAYTIHT